MLKWTAIFFAVISLVAIIAYIALGFQEKELSDAERGQVDDTFIDLSEGTLHYTLEGPFDGPLVVLAHGMSTPGFIFAQNVAALNAAGFRTLTFDYFGRGWSDRPRVRFDADHYDRTLLELLDGLKIEDPVGLVGLSMSGIIVAEFAGRHPERVSRVLLLAPNGLDVAGVDAPAIKVLRTPILGDFVWRVFWKSIILADPHYDNTGIAPENRLVEDPLVQMAYRGYPHAMLSTLRNLKISDNPAVYQRLGATGIPVLGVFGTKDDVILNSSTDRLTKAIPKAKVVWVEGGDHNMNYRMNTAVSGILIDWFNQGK